MTERQATTLRHPTSAASVRVLVADDDPASRRFLGDGLRSLGAAVSTCADGLAALHLARAERHDLLLLDRRMPHGGALQILAQLRQDAQASSTESIAVATSAEMAPEDRRQLFAAGFSDVLLKPCTLADLRRVLALVHGDSDQQELLNDDAALSSTGDHVTMRALRRLFRDELSQLERELDDFSHADAALAERMHRLRSSCGFCGAAALAHQATQVQQQLSHHGAKSPDLATFRKTLLATLQALDG